MNTYIAPPQAFSGSEAQQLGQVYRYLFRLSEELSGALNAVETQQQAVAETVVRTGGVTKEGLAAELTGQYSQIKSLIVKSADLVRSEMDVLETQLRSDYIAKSEWGEYHEEISAEIEATAHGIVQEYGYDAKIESLQEDAVAFNSYMISTNGYIRQGIIGYDDEGIPVIGVAIGQDLRSTTVDVDGTAYEEIDMTRNMATYTSDRIAFWQNGVEVGSFSNKELTTSRIRVRDGIGLGDWDLSNTNGLTLKWAGGDV